MPMGSTWLLLARIAGALGVPNLADLLYSYPDIRVIAHEPSLVERGIIGEALVETIELMDEEYFLKAIKDSEGLIII